MKWYARKQQYDYISTINQTISHALFESFYTSHI